jgi:hypothetical protein
MENNQNLLLAETESTRAELNYTQKQKAMSWPCFPFISTILDTQAPFPWTILPDAFLMDDAHPSELAGAASSSTRKQSKAKLRGVGRASRYNYKMLSNIHIHFLMFLILYLSIVCGTGILLDALTLVKF